MRRTCLILLLAISALAVAFRADARTRTLAAPSHARRAPDAPLPAREGMLLKGLLADGLRVLIWYDPALENEEVCLSVGVGSQQDMEHKQGAAALVPDLLLHGHSGGASAAELAAAWEKDGFELNAHADEDAASFHLTLSPADLAPGLDAFGTLIARCEVRPEDVDSAKVRAVARWQSQRPWSALEAPLRRDLYGQYGYHRVPDGLPETLDEVDREIARGYYSQYYRPNNAVLVMAGPVVPEDARHAAQLAFAPWEYGYIPPSNPNSPPGVDHLSLSSADGVDGAWAVAAAAVTPHLSTSDRVALELWAEASAEGPPPAPDSVQAAAAPPLTYGARLRRHRLCDEVRVGWTSSDSAAEGELRAWLGDLQSGEPGVPDSLFEPLKADCAERLLDARNWAYEASRATLFGWPADTPDELQAALDRLGPADVKDAVRRLLPRDHWALAVAPPPGSSAASVAGALR